MLQLDRNINLYGYSVGSQKTCLWIKQMDILFDIGISSRKTVSMNNLLISHSHLDHTAGLVYYLSQRKLLKYPTANIYVPPCTKRKYSAIIEAWEGLEQNKYNYLLIPVEIGRKYLIGHNYYVSGFEVEHRLPAMGYTIFNITQKLKTQYLGLTSKEIKKIKFQKDIFDKTETPVITYLGDCKFSSIIRNKEVLCSKYLIIESTFIDNKKDVADAHRTGHIHLDEIIENIELFYNIKKIILIHFSARYKYSYIKETINKRFPKEFLNKVSILE